MPSKNRQLPAIDYLGGASPFMKAVMGGVLPPSSITDSENPYLNCMSSQSLKAQHKLRQNWSKIVQALKPLKPNPKSRRIETSGFERASVDYLILEKKIHPMKAYRVSEGLDFIEVARRIPSGAHSYHDIENGDRPATFEQLKAFCHLFRIHPMEYILNFDSQLSQGAVELAIDAYNNPTRYHSGPDCHDDLRAALDEWLESDVSHQAFEGILEDLLKDNKPADQTKIIILKTFLANDGNKMFCDYGIDHYIHSEKDKIQYAMSMLARDIKEKNAELKTLLEKANTKGYLYFGSRWDEYRNFVLSFFSKYNNEDHVDIDLCRDIFIHDLTSWFYNVPKTDRESLFDLLTTISHKWSDHDDLDDKGNLLSQQLEDLRDFIKQIDFVFENYQTRQRFLCETNIGRPLGEPSDPRYMKHEWYNPQFQSPRLTKALGLKPPP